jgi:hypothetical protein
LERRVNRLPKVITCSNLDWPIPSPGLDISAIGNQPFSKTRLQGEKLIKYLVTFRCLVLCGRPGGQDRKVAPIISHISFRFAIVFMFAVLEPCESLMMLEK